MLGSELKVTALSLSRGEERILTKKRTRLMKGISRSRLLFPTVAVADLWEQEFRSTQSGTRRDLCGEIIGQPDGRKAWIPGACHMPASWLLRKSSMDLG